MALPLDETVAAHWLGAHRCRPPFHSDDPPAGHDAFAAPVDQPHTDQTVAQRAGHDAARTADRAHRKAAADDLAESDQVRADAVKLLRAAAADAAASRVERDLAAVRARVASLPRPRTLLVFGREAGSIRGIYVSGGYGFLNDVLEVAGGVNVFADIKRENIQISSEQVLARAPEAIDELRGPMTPGRLEAEREVWRQLPGVPAVRSGRIHLLQGDWLTVPGPRVAEAARVVADALHPPR